MLCLLNSVVNSKVSIVFYLLLCYVNCLLYCRCVGLLVVCLWDCFLVCFVNYLFVFGCLVFV